MENELSKRSQLSQLKYYHVTDPFKIENILQNGLVPYASEEDLDELSEDGPFGKAVHLWDNLEDVKAFCNWSSISSYVLEINLPNDWKIEKREMIESVQEFGYSGFEYHSRDEIPPKYIKIYSKCKDFLESEKKELKSTG